MKRLLLIVGLLLVPSAASACDTFRSVNKPSRTLVWDANAAELTVHQGKKARRFTTSSAGTGSGIVVAIPADHKSDPAQISMRAGKFWLGHEKFVEACK